MTTTINRRLIPGHYDWVLCPHCEAKHGWHPERCQRCGQGMSDRTSPDSETQDPEYSVSASGCPVPPDPVIENGDVAGSYFGGKGLCFRWLVNQIPPIQKLIVPFAGHCAIVRNALVYLDPPYLMETRRSGPRYRFEMTDAQHRQMLEAALELPCRVMISGYWSELYASVLADWRFFQFETQTRHGMATETVWCNYPEPDQLQDYQWLGADKRERFKLARREQNLIAKLKRFPAIERNALLAAVDSHFGARQQ